MSMIFRCLLWFVLVPGPIGASPSPAQDLDLNSQVVMTTSQGEFVLSFHPDRAPMQVKHFFTRVAAGAYDGTSFDYVVKYGLIQGGAGKKKALAGSETAEGAGPEDVRTEQSGLTHARGTFALVFEPGGADSGRFIICNRPQPVLDKLYPPCGFVAEGIEVVDRISETAVDANGFPLEPPLILKASLRPARPIPPPAFSEDPPEELARYQATLETTLGNITVEFFPFLAPNHVRNFLRLAKAGFYDGTAFHRVVRDFVMQGGLLSTRRPPLPDIREADLVRNLAPEFNDTSHQRGIVSMARYDAPDSAQTSFFICLGDAGSLDHLYTVFGRVIDGFEILERFQTVQVDGEAPIERIELVRVTLTRKN